MCVCVFFFQAEDGIRDWSVTGVQTCALPISSIGKLSRSTRRKTIPVSAGAGTSRTHPRTPVCRPTPSAQDSLVIVVWNIAGIVAFCGPGCTSIVLYYQRVTKGLPTFGTLSVVIRQQSSL